MLRCCGSDTVIRLTCLSSCTSFLICVQLVDLRAPCSFIILYYNIVKLQDLVNNIHHQIAFCVRRPLRGLALSGNYCTPGFVLLRPPVAGFGGLYLGLIIRRPLTGAMEMTLPPYRGLRGMKMTLPPYRGCGERYHSACPK